MFDQIFKTKWSPYYFTTGLKTDCGTLIVKSFDKYLKTILLESSLSEIERK